MIPVLVGIGIGAASLALVNLLRQTARRQSAEADIATANARRAEAEAIRAGVDPNYFSPAPAAPPRAARDTVDAIAADVVRDALSGKDP